MSLFDSVAGAVLGKTIGGKGDMGKIAMEMFNQNGGLGGILTKFQEGGLADVIATWVGKGENSPVSSNQISDILGSGAIADMASKFGISPEVLSSKIAEHLPNMVDKMTPNGEINSNSGNLLNTVLGMMK